jgi:hypothetical protein
MEQSTLLTEGINKSNSTNQMKTRHVRYFTSITRKTTDTQNLTSETGKERDNNLILVFR